MTVPLWLHAAAWWCAVAVLVSGGGAFLWFCVRMIAEAWSDAEVRPVVLSFGGGFVVLGLLFFVFGCPPAHSATLRWTAPTVQEGYSARGQRCLAGDVPERVALSLVVRQPPNGIARCVAKLPSVRGQAMAWTVPDSLRGAWFDVVAADSAGNKSCGGTEVWIP